MRVDLARCPEFVVGGVTVSPALREVRIGDRSRTLEPRAMQVLVVLAEAGGRVVSRDEMIARCWNGLAVGEGAIYRIVSLLRALCDDFADGAMRIETVAKVGYRLVAPASFTSASRDAAPDVTDAGGTADLLGIADAPAQAPAADEPATSCAEPPAGAPRRFSTQARRRLVWAVLALVLLTQAGAQTVGVPQHPRWKVESSRRLPPDQRGDASPRFSPDGSSLAYTVGAHGGHGRIYVRSLPSGTPRAISPPDENADSAAWASDGTRLAYVVTDPDGAPCRVMVVALPEGAPRMAGGCRHSPATQIAWQPGTPYLFLDDDQAPPFFSAIYRLDVETGRVAQVTTPGTAEADLGATVSPDGASLAYIGARGWVHTLRLRSLASGEEREVRCDPDVRSVAWASDSQSLIAAVSGPDGGELRACPVDGASGYRVYASASALGRLATGPDGALAVEVDERRTALARASARPRASADVVGPDAGKADWPAFAPDGTLAFVSDRSGETALWMRKPGGQPVKIFDGGQQEIQRTVWSPKGDRIAFIAYRKGDLSLHVVTAQGGEVVSVPIPSIGFGFPNWTPDGEHLVLFDKRIMQSVQVDPGSPDHRQPVHDKLQVGIKYRNGATYSTRGAEAGIWQLDRGPRLITQNYPAGREPQLAFLDDDVLLPEAGGDGSLRILAQPLAGGEPRVALYAPNARPDTPLAVDPLTNDVIYVAEVAVDEHVELLKLTRE